MVPLPMVKIAEPMIMKGLYQPMAVIPAPTMMELRIMDARYGIVLMPDPSAVVPLTAWK